MAEVPEMRSQFWADLDKDLRDPQFAKEFEEFARQFLGLQCQHEAWESTPGGLPHRCECGHVFTTAEANERKSRA